MRASVIIPVYNRENIIDRAIRSIANQGLSGWEIIVVDDASTDDTKEHIVKWEKKYPQNIVGIKFKEHSERVVAVNAGITYARGEWIIVLDSDDELAGHFIKAFEDARTVYPQAEIFSWGSLFHWHDVDPIRYVKTTVLQSYKPPVNDDGTVGVFRAGGITMGAFAFKKNCMFTKGLLPEASNCYSLGEKFLRWYPEIKPLYNEGQTDLGNPWGNDFMMAYHYSRGLDATKWVTLDQILHFKHQRT